MTRLSIFAHFDKDNKLDDYVVYYLQQIKKICDKIAFVSTSNLSENEVAKIKTSCARVIKRDNIGYDFVSWQVGINSIENIEHYDEIIICNDSVYGPLYPLDNIFKIMSKTNCDFWGMTNCHDIAYHLQSYFIVFRKNLINSESFKDFWDSVKVEQTKDKVIEKNEVGLTQFFMSRGFEPCVYASYSPSILKFIKDKACSAIKKSPSEILNRILFKRGRIFNHKRANPTHFYWKDLIVKYNMPFLKIELLRDNPVNINIEGYENVISERSDYNLDFIRKHLERVRRGNTRHACY